MSRPPKHPSVRARRNDPKRDFTKLSPTARIGKPVPVWPLQPDVQQVARLELARDRIASLQVELEEAEDGRTKGRLRRNLAAAELVAATAELQLSQARDAEVELWSLLWGMPQADVWEELHAGREVAQYVRWKIRAEQGDLKAATEARLLSDRLGLNPLALLRLRLEIEAVEAAEEKGAQRRRARPVASRGDGEDPRAALSAG